MANEAHTPTVLIAHFPGADASTSGADEQRLIWQVLGGDSAEDDLAVLDAGEPQQGAIPALARPGFAPQQVNVLHLSGQPFAFGNAPLGGHEREAQTEALRRLTASILHYQHLQVVVLSGSEHEELVRSLLLMGVPMVLSLRRSSDLPDQVEAFYAGLAAGQSVRQTLEMLADAYPEWELGFHEISYNPEREVLQWDAHRYPDGPNWTHGLIYRDTQWRSLTWRLRNPLMIPLSERRRWERRRDRPRRPVANTPDQPPLLTTRSPEEAAPPSASDDMAVRGRSRALRRGAQKARELREREQRRKQQKQRRRSLLIAAVALVVVAAVAIPLGMHQLGRSQEEEASLPPCPFPSDATTYRVLVLPFKQTPACNGGATYLSESLIVALKSLRKRGFRVDLRYQPMEACPLTNEEVQTTAELCYADLVVWGNFQQDTLGRQRRLEVSYQSNNEAGEQIFLTGAALRTELSDDQLPYADSLLRHDLVNLVLWARAYQHFNQEDYDNAIRAFLAIDLDSRAVSSLVTQMLTRSYVQAGRYEQAREYFGRLIDMHPDEPGYYLDRADMLSQMNEPRAALADLDRVLQMDPANVTAQVRRAKVYEQLGEYDQALADMNAVLATAPDLPALYGSRAEIYRASGQLDSAQADYQEALTLEPTYAEAHYGLGLVYQAKGEDEAALAAVDQALRYQPDLKEAGLFRADVLARQRQWQAADDAYSRVIVQQPSAEAYTRRGLTREALGAEEAALEDFKQATDLKPTHTPAWMGRARRYAATQRYEAALSDLNRVLELQPRHVEGLRLRTEVHLVQQAWEKALADVNLLITESPDDAQAYFFKALALLEQDNTSEAARMAKLAHSMGADSDRFRLLQGRIALGQGLATEAQAIFREVISRQPEWGEAYHFRGLAHLQLDQEAQAQQDLEQAAQLGGSLMDTYLRLGDLYQQAGRMGKALTAYQAFVERYPERPEGYLKRGMLYQATYRYDSALSDFNRGLSLDPQADRRYLLARGEVKTELGAFNQALVDFNQAIRQKPNDYYSYCLRGQLYQRMGNASKAELDLKQAAELAPASPEPWYFLAKFYREQGKQADALDAINEALRLEPTYAPGYNLRGELWVDLETYDRAVADFNQALSFAPSHANAYDNLADLARQAGDLSRAIENYSLALRHNPRHADALYQLGFIYALQDKYEQAIQNIRASLEIQPGVGLRYGFLAQIYARQRSEEPFFHYLQLALDHGYPLSELADDPAFRNYRDHPRFQQIMNAHGQ